VALTVETGAATQPTLVPVTRRHLTLRKTYPSIDQSSALETTRHQKPAASSYRGVVKHPVELITPTPL
jgi:hypothetical protein